jgi:nucleotidyltransferase/DNA polymerase involved in DNA repair
MPRTILHLDLDAFFCAVEETRNPSLRGKPFAVGGQPDERGVVSSCSYAARAFGVRSAMPTSRALRICPGLLIVSPRHRLYSEVSKQVMERLGKLTPLLEQISIDEAFLDLSDLRESPERLARDLQAGIRDELGLSSSIGIASNKLVAKIATEVGKKAASHRPSTSPDLNTPPHRPSTAGVPSAQGGGNNQPTALSGGRRLSPAVEGQVSGTIFAQATRPSTLRQAQGDAAGLDTASTSTRPTRPSAPPSGTSQDGVGPPFALTIVPAGEEAAFLAPLPADMLWGVGPKTAARLAELGIHTIGDIARWPESELSLRFGEHGRDLARHARGIDERPIVTEYEVKSISQEITFTRDVRDDKALASTLRDLSEQVGRRLRQSDLAGGTVKLKIRWPDFTTLTRQSTLPQPTDQGEEIASTAAALLRSVRRSGQAVRLIGVGVSHLGPPIRQLSLWENGGEKSRKLQEAVDALQERYGRGVIRKGTK